ncbi:c-type cytochrome [Alteromonadaceae bacterium M269]|nr:c-type cytochrome [Alteromonadaceae bacterium M269]
MTRNTKISSKGLGLLAFVLIGLIAGCSERKDPRSELTPEQRWARPDVTWTAEQLKQLDRGYQVYRSTCAACHLSEGQGQALVGAPALNRNPLVATSDSQDVIKVVLSGRSAMPSFAKSLDDNQVADLLSYVRNAWDNRSNDTVSAEYARQVRSDLSSSSNE